MSSQAEPASSSASSTSCVSTPDSSPLITVVVPAWEAARDIRTTLESVCGQTHRNIEVLVVDDGSTDNTGAIVNEFTAHDPRVRLIRQANAGVGAARNTAIRQARGEYIAPVDADDLWSPEKLERQLACLEEAGPSAGMAYCWSTLIDVDGNLLRYGDRPWIEGRILPALVLRNFLGNASVPLFRTSALKHVGLYLTREEQGGAQGCEDWDLHLRIARHYEIRLVPDFLVGYRQSSSSMSLQADGMSASFDLVIRRAREANPELPGNLFRWSTSHFYTYLGRKCYLWGDYRWSVRALTKAAVVDPMLLVSTSFSRLLAKATIHWICRTRKTAPLKPAEGARKATLEPPAGRPARLPLFARIQERRWAAALTGKLS